MLTNVCWPSLMVNFLSTTEQKLLIFEAWYIHLAIWVVGWWRFLFCHLLLFSISISIRIRIRIRILHPLSCWTSSLLSGLNSRPSLSLHPSLFQSSLLSFDWWDWSPFRFLYLYGQKWTPAVSGHPLQPFTKLGCNLLITDGGGAQGPWSYEAPVWLHQISSWAIWISGSISYIFHWGLRLKVNWVFVSFDLPPRVALLPLLCLGVAFWSPLCCWPRFCYLVAFDGYVCSDCGFYFVFIRVRVREQWWLAFLCVVMFCELCCCIRLCSSWVVRFLCWIPKLCLLFHHDADFLQINPVCYIYGLLRWYIHYKTCKTCRLGIFISYHSS